MADESVLLHASGPDVPQGGDGDETLSVSESEVAPVSGGSKAGVLSNPKAGHRRTNTPVIKRTAASKASSRGSTRSIRDGQDGDEEDNRAARELASKEKGAFVAYFKCLPGRGVQAETGVKMEHLQTNVFSVTSNDAWFADMKRRGKQKLGSHELDSINPNFRWIHLPSNNPEWIKGAMYQILDKVIRAKQPEWESNRNFAEIVRGQILCEAYWEDQEIKGLRNVHHSRFMKPFCRKMSKTPDSPAKIETNKHLVFFMPYVHWELSGRHAAMTKELKRKVQGLPALDGSTDAKLLHAYLSGPDKMHIRRTLDQSYYSTMNNTSARDQDQVTQRYAAEKLGKGAYKRPMLMVDQCWLWIIGGDTILTAFPQQWSDGSSPGSMPDETDIFGGIFRDLKKKPFLDKVTDVKTLAYLIIDRCACNVYDPESINDSDMQFLRQFDESIDNLMLDQTESLKQLWADVRKSKGPGIDDSMFDMTEDFETLEQIKDIMEELSMLTHIQNQQNKALKLLESEEIYPLEEQMFDLKSVSRGSHKKDDKDEKTRENDDGIVSQPGPSTTPPSPGHQTLGALSPTAVHAHTPGKNKPKRGKRHKSPRLLELLRRAEDRKANLALLAEKAKSSYKALHDLLDLKQRQARLSEAKQARRSAEGMEAQNKKMEVQNEKLQDQNNSIMLFTVVTILFLPLSSLASIFGINAVEFGQGHVTLARIFAYLFPISAFVVGFTFLLAFNTNIRLMLLLWLEISGTWLLLWFPTVSVNHYVEDLQKRLKKMQDTKSENGEMKYNAMQIVKADREKARSARKQEKIKNAVERSQRIITNGNNVAQNPVNNMPSAPTSGLLGAGALPAPLSDVHEDEIVTPNGSANPGSSKRAKIADLEIPRGGST